jgi:hypothetical protein
MTNQLKMGKRVSPKVIYKWSTNTWKDVQYH